MGAALRRRRRTRREVPGQVRRGRLVPLVRCQGHLPAEKRISREASYPCLRRKNELTKSRYTPQTTKGTNMAEKSDKDLCRMITPTFRLGYPHLDKAHATKPGDKPKFS